MILADFLIAGLCGMFAKSQIDVSGVNGSK
jgi:hypothetical protein